MEPFHPDPARATSPPRSPSIHSLDFASVSPIAQAHHHTVPVGHLARQQQTPASPADSIHASPPLFLSSSSFQGTPLQQQQPSIPAISRTSFSYSSRPYFQLHEDKQPQHDTNVYTGQQALDTSRRYSTGLPPGQTSSAVRSNILGQISGVTPPPSAPNHNTVTIPTSAPATSQGNSHNHNPKRLALFGFGATSAPTAPEQHQTFNPAAAASHHPQPHGLPEVPFSPGPLSPSFSISSFSGILPGSGSLSSITSHSTNNGASGTTPAQTKPPVLEYRHPIVIKDFDHIHILNTAQKEAIKSLCSTRVYSRIDTIGWYSIIGAQKFPSIESSQDAYDIEMATTCMAIEFGSDLSAEKLQEALGVVSFKGAKVGVDQALVSDPRSYAEQLIQGILEIILNLDTGTSASAYEFYQEALNLLIVMASTQLQNTSAEPNERNYFLNILLSRFSHLSDQLVLRLLWNFTDQRPSPPVSGSLVYSAYNYIFTKTGTSLSTEAHPIADRSILLLLLLITQAKTDLQFQAFRNSVRNIRDEKGSMPEDEKDRPIYTPFRKIFHIICHQIHREEVCLLLHVLLVENSYFKLYVLSRTDPETLEDDVFNDSIQKITMTYQPWFTERLLKSVSLGGLAVAIVIRTIQYNLAQHKDVYFHTNALAILANMSSSLQDMHPYVAQRLVSLFDIVARRYQKLISKLQYADGDIEQHPDVIVYGDMVNLVLEIINSTLTHKLKSNPQLVYSLLHKQEMFTFFKNHYRFKELIQNIEQAVQYFQTKVEEANIHPPTPEEVTEVIQLASRTWPPNLMKQFPDIKFSYEEEQQSHEFFVPYVWSLLYRNMFVYWDEEKAKILHDYRTVVGDETAFEGVPTGSQT
ncbi:hypothetical protein BGW42_000475 [Actinomortierella wolfii]|nr:hypothetical protein BGW42_000475 [Actinomortierella wolfii]